MSDQPRGMRIVGFALCFTMFLSLSLFAQEYRGSISGTASDPSGAAIPGVTVTITSIERNVSHTTITKEDGAYLVSFLLAGNYRLSAELRGFKRY